MGDEEKKSFEETTEGEEAGEKVKMDEDEADQKEKRESVTDDQQQLEKLEEEKKRIDEQREKDKEKMAQLSEEKRIVDNMATEAQKTADEMAESYERKNQDQQGLIEGRSKRDMEVKELSQKLETIREIRGDDDPELKELEERLNQLEEQARADDALEEDINERKARMEKLMEEHAESQAEIEAKRKEIEDEIAALALQREAREVEEKKILARIAELKGEKPTGEVHEAEKGDTPPGEGHGEQMEVVPKREVSFPLNDPTVLQLKELGGKALVAAKALKKLREELAEFQQKDHLAEEDMKTLPLKQNELFFRLAELDAITKRVQSLMGMRESRVSELGPPRKFKFSIDFGERPDGRRQSQLMDPENLPKVVVCGADAQYPQIIICESPNYRDVQERILRNGRFHSGAVVQGEVLRRPSYTQCPNNYPGTRSDVFNPMRQGEGMVMGSPYYGTGMMGSFGQGNMTTPIASWMIPPGFDYTMRPMQGVQSNMVMPRRMMHPGIPQSASVGSFIPCPCICPKKHKKKKKQTVPHQAYSCPSVALYGWRYRGT